MNATAATRKSAAKVTALVEAVKAHAEAHYTEGGWDVIVEAWSDDEIAAEIKGARTSEGAIKRMLPAISVFRERRADAIISGGEEPAEVVEGTVVGQDADAAPAEPAQRKQAPRWTKGQELADGYVAVWVHGYYVLASRPAKLGSGKQWAAFMADGNVLGGANLADAEKQAKAYGKAHGLVRGAR